jgi:F-type H+-transporting ATPase subunit b
VTFDLFTVAAQIVNFVILLVLLRLFLYAPVRRVMQERERRIAATREAADAAREQARQEQERLEGELDAWRRERRERERSLDTELNEQREARLDALEREMAEARAAMAAALERDRDETRARLRRRSMELLADELRRALHDLADASLERRAIAAFRARLADLGEAERAALRAARDDAACLVGSAFALDDASRAELLAGIRDVFGADAEMTVERDPELGFGVVLQVGGQRVAWSADAYADAFAEAQDALLSDAARDLAGASSAAAETSPDVA